jgi:hypothetical protein
VSPAGAGNTRAGQPPLITNCEPGWTTMVPSAELVIVLLSLAFGFS